MDKSIKVMYMKCVYELMHYKFKIYSKWKMCHSSYCFSLYEIELKLLDFLF